MQRTLAVLLIVLAAVFMTTACDKHNPAGPSVVVVDAPVISQFTADSVNPRLLLWTVVGGGNLTIRIEPLVGNVQAVGAQLVGPDTYTIIARNEGGEVRRSCVIR